MKEKKERILSAGHGGRNKGCRSADGRTKEEDINLLIAQAAQRMRPSLRSIRTHRDETLTKRQRNARAESFGAMLAVSIHVDNLIGSDAHGVCAYYRRGDEVGHALACHAVGTVHTALSGGRVVCAHDDPDRDDDNWLSNPQDVLDNFSMDAVLIEFGFFSDPANLALLRSTPGIDACAELVLSVIDRYDAIKGV